MTFRQMVAKLRREAPPLLPARVFVREKIAGRLLGSTSLVTCDRGKPLRFVIEVRRSSTDMMRDTLLHEWAHALTWSVGEQTHTDHSDPWALAYGRCYRIIVEQ